MKSAMNYRAVWAIGLTSALLGLGTVFQNCSQVSFAPAPIDDPSQLDCGSGCPERGEAIVTAGAQNMPKLRLFFVTDNSFTMKANQVNLATSFEKMFDQANSESLTPFDTTAFVINTAQYTYPYGSVTLGLAANNLKPLSYFESLGMASIDGFHRAAKVSGKIPGDELGYFPKFDQILTRWTFSPSTVAGFAADESGAVLSSLGVHKAAGEDPTAFKNEFQKRIAVLDPDRNAYTYPQALDRESGLCAMSRILRNNDAYVKAGELSAFVIVSDEEDSDADGRNCIDSITDVDDTKELVKGWCDSRKTTFSYRFPDANAPATCSVAFKSGYDVKYTLTNPSVTITNVEYRTHESDTFTIPQVTLSYYASESTYLMPQVTLTFDVIDTESYSAPRSLVAYTKIASQQIKRTTVNYSVASNCYRDGVFNANFCTHTPNSQTVDGDFTATAAICTQKALALSQNAAETTAPYAPTCSVAASRSGSCAYTDTANCVTTFVTPSPSETVYGSSYSTSQTACDDLARNKGGLVDAAHPATCSAITAATGSGACPAGATGCVSTKTYKPGAVTVVNGNYADNSAACDGLARSKGGQVLTGHPAHCLPAPTLGPLSGKCPDGSLTIGCATTTTWASQPTFSTEKVDGALGTDKARCDTAASNLGAFSIDSLHPATCRPAGERTANEKCPKFSDGTVKLGCKEAAIYGTGTATAQGDAGNCVEFAKTQPKADVVGVEHIYKCQVSVGPKDTPDLTATVNFDASIDPGPLAAANSACSESVKTKLAAQLEKPVELIKNCLVTAVKAGTPLPFTSYAPSCTEKATQVCADSSGSKRSCVGTETSQGLATGSKSRPEALTCDSLCTDSKTGACNLFAGVSPTANMTIRQYFALAMGSEMANTTCSAVVSTTSSLPFQDRLKSEQDQICQMVNGAPTYYRQDGASYHKRLRITDYVSGYNAQADGTYTPKATLPLYIQSRSAELFGEGLKPLVTTFVRSRGHNDPLGNNGSYGDAYEMTADLLGGQKESVLADNYSPALVSLGSVVKERLNRSFALADIKPYQAVRMVWFRTSAGAAWKLVPTNQWSASGGTLTILPSYHFVPGNQFRALYY